MTETTDPQPDRRQTVEYFLQSREEGGTWEDSSAFSDDYAWTAERLAKRQNLVPGFEYRIAQRTTTVVVGPADGVAPAAVPSAPADRAAEVANLRTMYDAVSARENELIGERDKLARWHREDADALAEMRATVERLRAELKQQPDRAAILREAADTVQAHPGAIPYRPQLDEDGGFWWDTRDRDAAANLLRRMADEAQPDTETPCCSDPTCTCDQVNAEGRCDCTRWESSDPSRMADEAQQPETQAGLKRAHVALAAQAGRDQAAVARVRAYLASQTDALPEGYPVAVPVADVLAALNEQPAVVSQPGKEA